MSYTQAEVELLRECLKEICDEHFFSTLHELRKKLGASSAKQQDLEAKIKRYEEEIHKLQACHKCHPLINIFNDASTQTSPGDFVEEAPQEPSTNETSSSTTGSNSHNKKDPQPQEEPKRLLKEDVKPRPSTSSVVTNPPEIICIDSDDDM